MLENESLGQVEFIHLNGHAVRVTSLKASDESATLRLVTITRGSRDAELLDEILGHDVIVLSIPDKGSHSCHVLDIDRRRIGEGQSGITRFSVEFGHLGTEQAPTPVSKNSVEERLTSLELEIASLKEIVQRLVNNNR